MISDRSPDQRRVARWLSTTTLGILFGIIVLGGALGGLVQVNVQKWAEKNGYDNLLVRGLDLAVSWLEPAARALQSVLSSYPFWWLFGFLAGTTSLLWLLRAVPDLDGALIASWKSLRRFVVGSTNEPAQSSPPPKPPPAASSEHPANIDLRSALLYAANRTWAPRQHDKPVDSTTARELQRILDALERFYELARHDSGLQVWGRTSMSRPLKLVERSHWQDWHIHDPDIYKVEPLQTVPRDRLPSNSSPYFDLRVNKSEVEASWSRTHVSMLEAARICFEETGLFGNLAIGGDLRRYQFVVHMILEGHDRPDLFSVWGKQLPSTAVSRVPPERLVTRDLRDEGAAIYARIAPSVTEPDWINLSVLSDELSAFIERLKKNETVGQQQPKYHYDDGIAHEP